MCFGDRTIEVKFVGFLSEQLIENFFADLGLMLGVIEWQFWGYYGDLTECDVESSITWDVLVELQKRFLSHGCIVDAHSIINPVAIENVVKSRKEAGLKYYLLDENLFPDVNRPSILSITFYSKLRKNQQGQNKSFSKY